MARQIAKHLSDQGLPKACLTNQKPFKQLNTVVRYRAGYRFEADQIGSRLTKKPDLMMSGDMSGNVQVRLVLGRDLNRDVDANPAGRDKVRVALK